MSAINLYTAPTPNGHKASVTLEELGLEYEVRALDLGKHDQKQEWYLKINPNGRIPAIIDHAPADGGGEAGSVTVFESGAIMIYLAEKTGRLLPTAGAPRAEALQWLMFQMGGVGPMMGQANVFYRYLPEKIDVAIDRYQRESRRLFEVLDRRLGESEWLGRDFSIADIANWCWVRTYRWSGVAIEGLPHLRRWLDAMKSRPACRKGIEVPYKVESALKDEKAEAEFAANARKSLA
ncbi:MAG: glutathione S-transferase N-terminal domain-containing protein [Caulobacterales bacterium]|nr:glutathione S-transferase N-terminal domain-containing protein [Caulobacterales bacterium]